MSYEKCKEHEKSNDVWHFRSVASACDAIAGKTLDKNVDTATTVVTKSNMYDPDIQRILYRFK